MEEVRKLKRCVIKEELVAITGDFTKAVVLQQFLYWGERVRDFDAYMREEAEKETQLLNLKEPKKPDSTHGWIYKTAEALSEETMLGVSAGTMRAHIKALVELGFLEERRNPKYGWDRTLQYRVNLYKVQTALMEQGYSLDGYPLVIPREVEPEKPKILLEENPVASQQQVSPPVENLPENLNRLKTFSGDSKYAARAAAKPQLPLEDVIATAAKTAKEKKIQNDAKPKRELKNTNTMLAYFSTQFTEVFGGIAPLENGKDKKLLKTMIEHYSYDTVKAMVDWMFKNWARFRRECKITSVPTVGILFGFRGYLQENLSCGIIEKDTPTKDNAWGV